MKDMHLGHAVQEWQATVVARANAFLSDVRRLWGASPLGATAIMAGGLFRGLGVALVFQQIGNFIDAAFGARGVGTVTSEFRNDLWQMLAVIFVVYAAYVFTCRLSGVSLSIVERISNIALPLSLVCIAFPLLEHSLTLMIVLWFIRLFVLNKHIVTALSMLIAGMSLLLIQDVLVFAATRTITVGTMISVGGAALFLGLWWAGRPYRAQL